MSFNNLQFASPTPRYHTANIRSSPLSSCAIQRTVTAVLSFCAISGAAFASGVKTTAGTLPAAGGRSPAPSHPQAPPPQQALEPPAAPPPHPPREPHSSSDSSAPPSPPSHRVRSTAFHCTNRPAGTATLPSGTHPRPLTPTHQRTLHIPAPHKQIKPGISSATHLHPPPLREPLRIKHLTGIGRRGSNLISQPEHLPAIAGRHQQPVLHRCKRHPLRRLQMCHIRKPPGNTRLYPIHAPTIPRSRQQAPVANRQRIHHIILQRQQLLRSAIPRNPVDLGPLRHQSIRACRRRRPRLRKCNRHAYTSRHRQRRQR